MDVTMRMKKEGPVMRVLPDSCVIAIVVERLSCFSSAQCEPQASWPG